MQANKLVSLWTMTISILISAYYSCVVMLICCFSSNKRKVFDYYTRVWSNALLRRVKVSYQVIDPYHLKFEPNRLYILMSNHASLYDIPLIFMALPGSIRMLTKKELFKYPIWGSALKAGEFISIDRENRNQAFKDLEVAKEKMRSGIILWVAPEGTRSRTGELGPFKKGGFMVALQTGATIIPIGIRGSYTILPPKTRNFNLGQTAEIHIGKPIEASQYTLDQRDELMLNVEESIRGLVGLAP